jgi:Protein of unknown function (DUF1822)
MVANFQDLENIAIPLPITTETREIARNFARQQADREKAKQVLHNTLAVLTVKNYLEMLGIATDLSNSDSWNPVMRVCDNVADLDILDLGKLECRPLQSSDTSCHIPMEVWDSRLGYVMVKIDDSLRKALLLGFMAQVASEEIAVADLQPIEALIDRLHDLRALTTNSAVINLGEWFNNIFTPGWSTVETLLNPRQLIPAWGFRNAESADFNSKQPTSADETEHVQRAKLINLGIQLKDRPVVLLVDISPEANGSMAVTLQVHPSSNAAYLPETLILRVVESSGQVFMEAQARSRDNFIQLQFSGEAKELFTVQIMLDDAELTEQFQI